LIELCLSNVALAGRSSLSADDAERAVAAYSSDMLRDLNYEVRDVFPEADKIIYGFAKENFRLDQRNANGPSIDSSKTILAPVGFFGVIGADGSENYIFDHGDDIELLLPMQGSHRVPSSAFIRSSIAPFRFALTCCFRQLPQRQLPRHENAAIGSSAKNSTRIQQAQQYSSPAPDKTAIEGAGGWEPFA